MKTSTSGIPIVDLQAEGFADELMADGQVQKLYKAFKDIGFVYVKGHGIPDEVVHEAFEWVCYTFVPPKQTTDQM